LIDAVNRLKKQKQKRENFQLLKENIERENLTKIAVPSGNNLIFIDTEKIMYIKGEGAYSEIFMNGNMQQLVSRNLKNFEDILCSDERFIRIHKSYIVNFDFVSGYTKSDGGNIIIEKNIQLPISTDKVSFILDKIQFYKR